MLAVLQPLADVVVMIYLISISGWNILGGKGSECVVAFWITSLEMYVLTHLRNRWTTVIYQNKFRIYYVSLDLYFHW